MTEDDWPEDLPRPRTTDRLDIAVWIGAALALGTFIGACLAGTILLVILQLPGA